ncbi:probable (S)-N-methylcoclaurine 3'-hydroxylase isozyme 2 [Malania oleifera]|uniref:probable (S)-N-methylcoclaurine 3'-hydroxylase isozyme 2 n=1 Tax=Malania oleifera TaxID=397392 RepID=UPI0025AE4671|nr:probable (S)-N-methylcoclaurine 3'-hydroxylase isozyme 2 [Malania oleifera]
MNPGSPSPIQAYLILHSLITSTTMEATQGASSPFFISADGNNVHLLTVPILLLLPLLFLFLKHRSSKHHNLPPGPFPWPIVGNIASVGYKQHEDLAKLAQAHGPLMSLRMGSQLVVVGSNKAAAIEILKTHDRVLSGRLPPHVSPAKSPERNHLSIGWTFECTEQWKFMRTLCRTELFGGKILDSRMDIRAQKVQEMVDFLATKEGQLVAIREVIFSTAFNVLGNVLMSKDFMALEEGEGQGMCDIVRNLMELWTKPNISDLYPFLGELDIQGWRREAYRYSERLYEVWRDTMKEKRERMRRGEESKTRDFLDVLLHNNFADDQVDVLFLELFLAGTDTSTSTIEWTIAELLKNQNVMKKICEELEKEAPEGYLKEIDITRFPYLQACVKETLRLHPAAPLIPRRSTEKCQVMNYNIPKDTQVLVNIWSIGRDPRIWEDPASFKPERLLNSELDFKGHDFEFLPFGGGRKICPGYPMAIRQVHLTLAALLHHFDWSLPNNMTLDQLDMNEKCGITLQKEDPLVLIPTRKKRSQF